MIDNKLIAHTWFNSLMEDLRSITIERRFNIEWEKVLWYHEIGSRILEDYDKFTDKKRGEILEQIAVALQKSERTIYYAISFAKEYPQLEKFNIDGKCISWTKIIKLLSHKEEGLEECKHNGEWIAYHKCNKCGKFKKYNDKM